MRFERTICSRCGGSGHYSYNATTGTTCFKCHGAKETLTSRGLMALEWFRAQSSVPASELVPGQRATIPGMGKINIVSVEWADRSAKKKSGEWSEYAAVYVQSKTLGGYYCAPETLVQIILPAEEHNALLAKAIEYQNGLKS